MTSLFFAFFFACATPTTDTSSQVDSFESVEVEAEPEWTVYDCVDHRSDPEIPYLDGLYPLVRECGESYCAAIPDWQEQVESGILVTPCDLDTVEVRWI